MLLTDIFYGWAAGPRIGALLDLVGIGIILDAIARKKADPAHKGIATAGLFVPLLGDLRNYHLHSLW